MAVREPDAAQRGHVTLGGAVAIPTLHLAQAPLAAVQQHPLPAV